MKSSAKQLPDYLDVRAADLTAQEYLANKLAHVYTLILKQWAGAQGRIKTFVEEFLPYYVARCVHIAFLRVFPQYVHVFSQQFLDNLYYNLVYAMTGVVPYPDILRSTVDYYFGWGGSEHSVSDLEGKRILQKEINFKLLAQFIPSGSQLFGDPLVKAVNPVTGVYTNELNKSLNSAYDINSQYKVADFQDNQDKQITV